MVIAGFLESLFQRDHINFSASIKSIGCTLYSVLRTEFRSGESQYRLGEIKHAWVKSAARTEPGLGKFHAVISH